MVNNWKSNQCMFLFSALICVVISVILMSVTSFRPWHIENTRDHIEQTNKLKWWQTTIIYQIYPRSFQDSNGDGIGDLQGIISRIEYFNFIHVGAIWISPFYKSPMRDFGYDVSDYRQVDPMFGTMDDFEFLVHHCHERGIKIIVDFVPNHTSNESLWFNHSRYDTESSKYRNFYIWSTGKFVRGVREPPNNWQSVFGGSSWQWDDVRQAYYYHNYLSSQPDLNYRNPKVLEEMDSVLRFWLDKDVDGFRLDAVTYLFEVENLSTNIKPDEKNLRRYTKNQPEIFAVIKRWRAILDEFERVDGKSRILIAETNSISHEDRINYYESGSIPFFFDLMSAKAKCGATTQCFLDLIKMGLDIEDGHWPNFVIGSHDKIRIADNIGSVYIDAMNMMLLTLPGTPTTYYGEELGMRGGDYSGFVPKDTRALSSGMFNKSRDPERNPMQWDDSLNAGFTTSKTPWLPVTPNTDYLHINVKAEQGDSRSHLSIYRKLADIRQRPAFQNSYIELPAKVENILTYIRGDEEERYLVAINLGNVADIVPTETDYTRGLIELSTLPKTSKYVDLSKTELHAGEGIILRLLH